MLLSGTEMLTHRLRQPTKGMSAMTGTAKLLKYSAFALMALFGAFGTLFVIGEVFADPGGWAAVGLAAAGVLPTLALIVYAVVRKDRAWRVFVVITVLVAATTLLEETVGIVPRDGVGPVMAVGVFALGFALAFLGLHLPRLAGALMIILAGVQLAAIVLGEMTRDGQADGRPISAVLTGSSGVMVVPLLVVGALFVASGAGTHEPWRSPPRRLGPAH